MVPFVALNELLIRQKCSVMPAALNCLSSNNGEKKPRLSPKTLGSMTVSRLIVRKLMEGDDAFEAFAAMCGELLGAPLRGLPAQLGAW